MIISTNRARSQADWATVAIEADPCRSTSLPRVLLVLGRLGMYADARGVCWPTVATVARDCRMGRRSTQAALSWLARHGLIQRVHRRNAWGRVIQTLTIVRRNVAGWAEGKIEAAKRRSKGRQPKRTCVRPWNRPRRRLSPTPPDARPLQGAGLVASVPEGWEGLARVIARRRRWQC